MTGCHVRYVWQWQIDLEFMYLLNNLVGWLRRGKQNIHLCRAKRLLQRLDSSEGAIRPLFKPFRKSRILYGGR
jgi:hypothetical protein